MPHYKITGYISSCCNAGTITADTRGYEGPNNNANYVRRRKQCKKCNRLFTTVELEVTVGHEYEYKRIEKLVRLMRKTKQIQKILAQK